MKPGYPLSLYTMGRKASRIMGKKNASIIIALVFSSGLSPAGAQQLWPGDANNNGIVNAVDLLYLGQAFGSDGPERAEITTEWEPQIIPTLWGQSFPNGLNYAYADCNGDGEVDDEDFEDAIDANFWRTHGSPQSDGFANGSPGIAPRIHLSPSATLAEAGMAIEIGLSLGDQNLPISSFYGISLLFSYDPELLEPGSFDFDFAGFGDSWITFPREQLFRKDEAAGKAQIAITRLNHQSQGPGFGPLGKFSIVIEDIIVGLEMDTFRLQVDSILLVDALFNTYPIAPDTAAIIIAKDTALVSSPTKTEETSGLIVFPNPASGLFHFQCSEPLTELRLFDALGRTFPVSIQLEKEYSYVANLYNTPPGMYWLIGKTAKGAFKAKIAVF